MLDLWDRHGVKERATSSAKPKRHPAGTGIVDRAPSSPLFSSLSRAEEKIFLQQVTGW